MTPTPATINFSVPPDMPVLRTKLLPHADAKPLWSVVPEAIIDYLPLSQLVAALPLGGFLFLHLHVHICRQFQLAEPKTVVAIGDPEIDHLPLLRDLRRSLRQPLARGREVAGTTDKSDTDSVTPTFATITFPDPPDIYLSRKTLLPQATQDTLVSKAVIGNLPLLPPKLE
ncbi:hypothetical protein [Rhodococcus sp. Eu-32]|uniref:hypothetical protein n=1 Tax=Rhodococcus sp. Eu-32 TaxID=1017319 RepID=UPI001FB33023|nr:hypothetical protein [Rhodococcus sp. Eu-32]